MLFMKANVLDEGSEMYRHGTKSSLHTQANNCKCFWTRCH